MGAMTLSVARPATEDNVMGFYWVDSNQPVAFNAPPPEIEVSDLKDGLHTFNIVVYNDKGIFSTPQSSTFFKVPGPNTSDLCINGILFLDGKILSTIKLQNAGDRAYACDIDMNSVSPGVHNIQLLAYSDSGTVSNVVETWFLRIPSDTELTATKVACFIDGIYVGQQELNRSGTVYLTDIDTQSLKSGIHSIDISMVSPDGTLSSFEHGWFYRTPIPNGITAYDYWFDDNYQNPVYVILEKETADFGLTTMVDIPQLPFDSRKYELSIQDGKLSVNGKHTLNMRFYESDGRTITKTSDFAESRNTLSVENIATLYDGFNHVATDNANEIKWYKFYGEIGDSIMICSDRPSMFELFSPSGKELIRKSGPHSQAQSTLTLLETGTYYFAAHTTDITNRADFNITFNHVPRNAILTVSPGTNTQNSGFTFIELFGNGMNDAKSIAIQSANGLKFETDSLFAWDNYHLSGTVKHPEDIPLGKYDVSMVIIDKLTGEEKIITKPDALEIISSAESPNIIVEVVPVKKASTPYMVDIFVTNDSDIPCWGIPFNIACERDGGRNGFIFYMTDFLGSTVVANTIPWYESDNILGTGNDGIFFPLVISTLQPHEKRNLRVGIISEPHKLVGLYAWAGTPYSEESKQLASMSPDSLDSMTVMYSNFFDLKTAGYALAALEEIRSIPHFQNRAPAEDDNNHVLEHLEDYGPDLLGRYPPINKSAGSAGLAANIGKANGLAFGSTGLGTQGAVATRHLIDNCGYSGDAADIIKQIEAQYSGCEYDPNIITIDQVRNWYIVLKNARNKAFSPTEILRTAFEPSESKLTRQLCEFFVRGNCQSSNPMPTKHEIDPYQAGDPNMITGYSDPTGGNSIGIDVKTLDYTIEFENDPAIATASASTITVEDNMDVSVFDLASFTPKEVRIGKHTISVPESHHFVKTFDMRPEIQCIAEISFDYDPETGKALWKFESLDPLTLNPTIDFRQGLLPVNNETGRGIGFIDYSIKLKDNLQHNVSVDNKAVITFDDNIPIETPTWSNVTDYKRPESTIIRNDGYSDGHYALTVEFSDEGSGIHNYDLCVRTSDNGKWYIVKTGLTDREIRFETPEAIPGIQFTTIATDRAGNRQIYSDSVSGIDDSVLDNNHDDSEPQRWYNLQGIPISDFDDYKIPGIIISDKGKKIIVR